MERLIARLERRFGRYAPEGIILWIVGLSGFLHLAAYAQPQILPFLWLDPQAVLHGEVWRVVTFLLAPTGTLSLYGLIWAALGLWFLHTMGVSLEGQWGSFRFDLFFFVGAIGTLAIAFVVGPVPGIYVAEALLLAFALEFPDYQVLLIIIPVKVKYLGALSAATMAWALVSGDWAVRAAVLVAVGDFLLFCGKDVVTLVRGASRGRRRQTSSSRAFAQPEPRKARVCARCGRSDADDPNLEFRVCDCAEKCHGKLTEYCIDHARNH